MSAAYRIGPPKNAKELSALSDILAPVFNFAREQAQRYEKLIGPKNFRVIKSGSTTLGGSALINVGQFFGGRSVPMTGVAAVGIGPQYRSGGAATALMRHALSEMHSKGTALSTLYPATLPLYQRVGYQQAGGRYEIRIALKQVHMKMRDSDLELRRITPKDHAAIEKLYAQRAVHAPGNLDRTPFFWQRVREPRGETAQGFAVFNTRTSKPEAYVYYLQKPCENAPYRLTLTDLIAITPGAGRRILAFLADHRSMADFAVFYGTPDDPIIKLLPERSYSAKLLDHWMLRIVDIGAALTTRGYPAGLQAEIHLDVQDDLLTANNGRYVITVNDGKAAVETGGSGDIIIDIRGLAGLYSGHMSPHDLLITGQLSTSRRAKKVEATLASAAAVFAGSNPWMGDSF